MAHVTEHTARFIETRIKINETSGKTSCDFLKHENTKNTIFSLDMAIVNVSKLYIKQNCDFYVKIHKYNVH